MATTISEMFVNLINEGIKATKMISNPKEKAEVCAELAKAIAMSGLVHIRDTEEVQSVEITDVKESLKSTPKEKQVELKTEKTKLKKTEIKEEVKEEVKEEAVKEPEVELLDDEWTEQMIELKQKELETIESITQDYGDDTINECVKNFSEGVLKSIEEITPLNINAFITYVELLMSDAE